GRLGGDARHGPHDGLPGDQDRLAPDGFAGRLRLLVLTGSASQVIPRTNQAAAPLRPEEPRPPLPHATPSGESFDRQPLPEGAAPVSRTPFWSRLRAR